jgi:hypothetical protein
LSSLFEHLTPGGKILVATYEDGCPWDRFAGDVYERLGLSRAGGAVRHLEQIEAAGLRAERVASLDTFLWARSLPSLFDTLEFFFLPKTAEYHARAAELFGRLEPFAEPLEGGRVGIKCVEVVFELLQRRQEDR